MKLRSNNFLILLIIFASQNLLAQDNDPYLFPIKHGERNYLAGTMGEMRGSHFHGGIDVKTGSVTGYKVYAIADGYVSRIKVSTYGYGHALYIYHPEHGTTSVYGHLESYNDDIADYVLKKQYSNRSFSIELFPERNMFPVKKGDVIGYSGNTGGSTGPHLHFEIRDNAQRPMNPLYYNFEEIIDNIPPVVQLFGIKPINQQARVDELFETKQFTPYRKGNNYYYNRPIKVWGKIGLMVMGYDLLDGVPNRNGIPNIEVKLDDELICKIHVNKVPFAKNRNILVYRDYQLKNEENKSFRKLWIDDGNELDFFESIKNKGIICIDDTLEHKVEIKLTDAYDNVSNIHFTLQGKKPNEGDQLYEKYFKPFQQKVEQNTLVYMGKKGEHNAYLSEVYANRMKYEVTPSYYVNDYAVYHWDLRNGLPDSLNVCNEKLFPQFDIMVPSGKTFSYYQPHLDLHFGKRTLFDTLYFHTEYVDEWDKNNEYFVIGEDIAPLRSNLYVTLKPKKEYKHRDKVAAYRTTNLKNFSYEGGKWENDDFEFSTRTLGKFTLLEDTIPPSIRLLHQSRDKISFRIRDELSGIDDYDLYVNGKWVLLHYDYKRNYFWTEKLNKSEQFKGEVVLTVTDNAGNKNTYQSKIY